MRVSYRLGLTPEEVEESVNKVKQLANQLFQFQTQNSLKNKEENSTISPNFPGKFAYLFLLENNKNGGKLSMGLDELLDSLLCHQLIIQISTELILFENNNELLKTLILSCLNVTVEICEQFEERKGLGNLLQKLTDLPSPANLWNIYLSTLDSLIKIEINQALNELMKDQKEENLNKFHIKQIINLVKRLAGDNEEKRENKIKEENILSLALTKLLNLLEGNGYSTFEGMDLERKTKMLKNIKLMLAEEIEHLLLSEQSKLFSVSTKESFELFKKKLII
uniref:Uncharacterized protein n=1 Tax=Meloidogyne incognita TaxID=6306 RepID=A0A914NIL9_MELIC